MSERSRWAALLLVLHLVFGENPWSSGAWERLEWGQNVRPVDAMTFTWLAALGNLAIVALLFATARGWLRPMREEGPASFEAPRARDTTVRRVLVAGAMLVLLVQCWPRMDHSLWTDEEYSARRSVVGAYEVEPDGTVEWEKVGWRETLWAYRQPNNHVPFSILSRLSTRIAGTSRPEEGMEVVVEGKMTASGMQSKFGLNAQRVEIAGEGALLAMLEKRKKALEAEGLFAPERKQKLPYLPEVIGVVTSPQGAVIRDILQSS